MNFLITVAAFVFALGTLIVFHEFGHYIVARWCGVKVLRFSLGFGRPLLCLKRGRDQTEWVVAAFPLGGYVKMLDEREGPVEEHELGRSFNRQSVGKRSWPKAFRHRREPRPAALPSVPKTQRYSPVLVARRSWS